MNLVKKFVNFISKLALNDPNCLGLLNKVNTEDNGLRVKWLYIYILNVKVAG